MSFEKIESIFYFVSGCHQSATKYIESDVINTGQKIFFGNCV